MVQTYNATRNLTDDLSLTDALGYYKTKILQGINTIILGEVLVANNTTKRLTVISLINGVDSQGNAITPPQIYDVPYGTMRGGNAGLITQYKKGDNVIIGFCQRQIESTKRTGAASTPTLTRFHDLADAVVLAHWGNDDPTIYIKILETGIEIQGLDQNVTVNTTGNVTASCANATITATEDVTVSATTAEIVATTSATITAPTLTVNGSLVVTGSITAATGTIGGIPFTTHEHSAGTYTAPSGGGAVIGDSGAPM